MTLVLDPKYPGRWFDPGWQKGQPGTFVVVIGVSHYDHLPDGRGGVCGPTYGLGQLHNSAGTARQFFDWLRAEYYCAGCAPATCWLLLSPTERECRRNPALAEHQLRPTFEACKDAIRKWFIEMNELPRDAAMRSRAIFFFSGHGLQPYLEPVLVPCDYLKDGIVEDAIRLNSLHAALRSLAMPLRFFFIDACRNDSVGRTGIRVEGAAVLNVQAGWVRPDLGESAPIFFGSVSGGTAWQPLEAGGTTLFGQALLDGLRGRYGIALAGRAVRVSALGTFLKGRIAEILAGFQGSARQGVELGGNALDATVTELVNPPPSGRAGPTVADVERRRFTREKTWQEVVQAAREGDPDRNAAATLLVHMWQGGRLRSLTDLSWSDVRSGCVVHGVRHDEADSAFLLTFSIQQPGGHWMELEARGEASAFLLPGDEDRPPRFLLDVAFGQNTVSHLEIRLATDNAGSLGSVAAAWEVAATRSLIEAADALPAELLTQMLEGPERSQLAGVLAGVLLLRAGRFDGREEFFQRLVWQPPEWGDGPVLFNQYRDLTGGATPAELADELLRLETRDLPCTAQTMNWAFQQTANLLRAEGLSQTRQECLEKLERRLARLLGGYQPAGFFSSFAGQRPSLKPELALGLSFVRFVRSQFPAEAEAMARLVGQFDFRLDPTMAGGPEPSLEPYGIHATKIGGLDRVTWKVVSTEPKLRLDRITDDGLPAPGEAVRLESDAKGTRVTVNVERFPSDERWRGFWLVSEASGRNVEMVWLRKGGAAGMDAPIGLVEDGFLADAWIRARQQNWGRTRMLGLLAVIWPKMRMLLEEIAGAAILRTEISRWTNELDARQVGVRDQWMKEGGGDGPPGGRTPSC